MLEKKDHWQLGADIYGAAGYGRECGGYRVGTSEKLGAGSEKI